MEIPFMLYSFKEAGRDLLEDFLTSCGYTFCLCDSYDTCKLIHRIHLKYKESNNFNFNRVGKCVVLYRTDIVEQIYKVLQLDYRKEFPERDWKLPTEFDYKSVKPLILSIKNDYEKFKRDVLDDNSNNFLILSYNDIVLRRKESFIKILDYLNKSGLRNYTLVTSYIKKTPLPEPTTIDIHTRLQIMKLM